MNCQKHPLLLLLCSLLMAPLSSWSDGDATPVAAETEEQSSPAQGVRFRFDLEGGFLEGRLSDQKAFETELTEPIIPEGIRELWLHVRSGRPQSTRLYATLYADDVFGLSPEVEFFRDYKLFIEGEGWSPRIRLPMTGLGVGRYRLNLSIEDGPEQDLFFEVTTDFPLASQLADGLPPAGFNLAARALGGRVHSFSAQQNSRSWAAANLVDGFTQTYDRRGGKPSSGWRTKLVPDEPPEIVIGFHQNRAALVQAVVFDVTRTSVDKDLRGKGRKPSKIPRHVEIMATTEEEPAGFEKIADVRLFGEVGLQWVDFEPVEARFVQVRFLNNYGESEVVLGELMVIEAASLEDSIVADMEINLAAPELGGGLAWVTSQDPSLPVAGLFGVDGKSIDGWRSVETKKRPADYLPQDFVFTFSADRTAYVDFVELSPREKDAANRWVRSVAVGVSEGTGRTFEEIARVEVPDEVVPVRIPVQRDTGLVRIRVLDNHGGDKTAIGGLRVVEGSRPGYQSLAHDHIQRKAAGRTIEVQELPAAAAPDQNEPNDAVAAATPYTLEQKVSANLHVPADRDYFQVAVPGDEPQAVTVSLTGAPSIRTVVALEDDAGVTSKEFLPAGNQGTDVRFTWLVEPGEHVLQLSEPPLSMVVVWDTSGSMEGRMDALESAVRGFLGGVEAGERVQLIRFSDDEEALLSEFTSDNMTIEAALEGQFDPIGATALVDALVAAESLLGSAPGRRVIVAFTDGQDTASEAVEGEFWADLGDSSSQIYTIGLGSDLSNYSHRTGSTGHQFLNNLATLTNGRYFHAREAADIGPIFQSIAAELRARPEYEISLASSADTGTLRVVSVGERIPALSPPRFELILDASGSMKRKVADGRTRMEVAKTVLKDIVKDVPDGVEVGLRVFGNRVREGQSGDCSDTELLQPMGVVDKVVLSNRIDSVQALGTTLIAYTLEQLPGDLGAENEDQFVVLVTDGEEECREDLLETVARLRSEGLNMNLSIVGFAIDDEEINRQLDQIAEAGGGTFVKAEDADELNEALSQALATLFFVQDAGGSVVARGTVNGHSLAIAEGNYDVVVQGAAENLFIQGVVVSAGQHSTVELDRQGNEVGTRTIEPEIM